MKDNHASLLKKRAEVQARVAALAEIENAGTDLTAEQLAEFTSLTAEFEQLTAKIQRAEASERMQATTSKPVGQASVVAQDRPKGFALAAMVQSLAATKGDVRAAANYADQTLNAPEIAAALNTGTGASGGFVVPPSYTPELIELLRPASIVRMMGARSVPMPNGTMKMPKLAGGATAGYGPEGADITKTEQSFGELNLSKKKLTALVPISNDLVRFANPNAIGIVRDDLINAIGQREDLAFILGDGTLNTPVGLRNWASVANVFAANATVNIQNVRNDLGKMRLALRAANSRMINPGYLLPVAAEEFLMNLLDDVGNLAFPEMSEGRIGKIKYVSSNQLPSDIMLVDFADAIIGEATGLILDVSTEATYKEGANLISAFSRDETVVRAITEHDFGMRHAGSVAVLTGALWIP
jgi:HK97 family phage major capsid protein